MKQTLADAKEVDQSIKLDDVRQWMAEHTKRKKHLPGQNNFTTNGPHRAYQLDIMFMKRLEDQKYDRAMLCIDTFTKYAAVKPVKGKSEKRARIRYDRSNRRHGEEAPVHVHGWGNRHAQQRLVQTAL